MEGHHVYCEVQGLLGSELELGKEWEEFEGKVLEGRNLNGMEGRMTERVKGKERAGRRGVWMRG